MCRFDEWDYELVHSRSLTQLIGRLMHWQWYMSKYRAKWVLFQSSLIEIDTHSHVWITHLHSDHRWRNENTENMFEMFANSRKRQSFVFSLSNFSLFSNSVRTSSTVNAIGTKFQHNKWKNTYASISKENFNHKSEHSINIHKMLRLNFCFVFAIEFPIDRLVHFFIWFVGSRTHTHRRLRLSNTSSEMNELKNCPRKRIQCTSAVCSQHAKRKQRAWAKSSYSSRRLSLPSYVYKKKTEITLYQCHALL